MNKNKEYMKNNIGCVIKNIFMLIPFIFKKIFDIINKRLKFSITFKTTAINTTILTIILFFSSSIMTGALYGYLMWKDTEEIQKNIFIVIDMIKSNNNSLNQTLLKSYSSRENLEIAIFDKNKDLYYTSSNNSSLLTFHDDINSINNGGGINNNSYIYLNRKVSINDNIYYIQIVQIINGHQNIVGVAVLIFFTFNTLIIIFSGFVLSRTSKRMLRPIENMTKTAKSISINALDTRLDVVESHDELKELAAAFNDMLFRLELAYEQQNQFVSDASHELRTPIAVVQGYVNMLNRWGKDDRAVLEEGIAAIKSESDNMKELVEKLLFLARTDKNTQKLEKEPFSSKEFIDEIIRETRMIDTKHMFLCEKNDSSLINGDRGLIKQALRIFIDNSIKYTPENGLIKINAASVENKINITIQDNGIGISREDLPHIFDRFYRCDKSRAREKGGTGLGLSIAKWIIAKHNGTINVASELNKGTKIVITLPNDILSNS